MSDDVLTSSPAIESRKELDDQPRSATYWQAEIKVARARLKDWRERGEEVLKVYRAQGRSGRDTSRMSMLWSNTRIKNAALDLAGSNADVRRKHLTGDPVARTVATILERSLDYCADEYDFLERLEGPKLHMLIPGRGQMWVEYDPDEETLEAITVPWDEFLHQMARQWDDVRWVARSILATRAELVENLGDIGKIIPLNEEIVEESGSSGEATTDAFKRARIWEIWDKTRRERVYISEHHATILRTDADPLGLKGFFPCPEPLYAIDPADGLIPQAEYDHYQDLAEELDEVMTRIRRLIKALKRRGAYNAALEGELKLLAKAGDDQFVPIENWAMFLEAGGLEGNFQVEELKGYAEVLTSLYEQRRQIIDSIWQIVGISDIMRGSSNATETLGAQKLKSQFGSISLKRQQAEIQRFARDIYRIKAEIMCEHWGRDKFQAVTDIKLPTEMEKQQAQQLLKLAQMQIPIPPDAVKKAQEIAESKATWEQVEQIIRSDERRSYKVSIETEITAFQDAEEEKQNRIEFVTFASEGMQKVGEGAMAAPQLAPFFVPIFKETMMFAMRAFKAGRTLEETFEDKFDELQKAMPQMLEAAGKQGGEDPSKMAEVQRKAARDQADIEAEQKRLAFEQRKLEAEITKMHTESNRADVELQCKVNDCMAKAKQGDTAAQAEAERLEMEREKMVREDRARIDDLLVERDKLDLDGSRLENEKANADAQTGLKRAEIGMDRLESPNEDIVGVLGELAEAVKDMAKPQKVVKTKDGMRLEPA